MVTYVNNRLDRHPRRKASCGTKGASSLAPTGAEMSGSQDRPAGPKRQRSTPRQGFQDREWSDRWPIAAEESREEGRRLFEHPDFGRDRRPGGKRSIHDPTQLEERTHRNTSRACCSGVCRPRLAITSRTHGGQIAGRPQTGGEPRAWLIRLRLVVPLRRAGPVAPPYTASDVANTAPAAVPDATRPPPGA